MAAHLGHVNYYVISFLNKSGYLPLTSLLPSPSLCSTCQFVKSHRLPYSRNEHRSPQVLDLIHYDLWVLPLSNSIRVFFNMLFYSRFSWLYPLKFKYDFFDIFLQFRTFVENQPYACIKIFKSDGGA